MAREGTTKTPGGTNTFRPVTTQRIWPTGRYTGRYTYKPGPTKRPHFQAEKCRENSSLKIRIFDHKNDAYLTNSMVD